MIYLIGGAPRCGKTMLSKQIALKKNCSWVSTDTIRSMVLASTQKSRIDTLFPFEKLQRSEKAGVPYQDVASNTPQVLLRAEITESNSLWPSVRAMIETLIDAHEEYVIEGVHLMPELIHTFKGTPHWKQIRLVYLVKTDLNKIIEGFAKNPSKHDWIRGALTNASLTEKIARVVQVESGHVAAEAEKYGFKVYNTEKNFKTQLSKAARELRG